MLRLPRRIPAAALLAVGLGSTPSLAAQGLRLGIAAGMEAHGPWTGSIVGPSAAISLSTRLTSRLQVQGVLTASGRIASGGETLTLCPQPGCDPGPTDPALALGGTLELVLSDHPGESGGYVLGGAGLVRFSGRSLVGAPVRGQLAVGLGGVLVNGRSQVFIEARLHRTVNAGPNPRWSAPLRLGWRTRL